MIKTLTILIFLLGLFSCASVSNLDKAEKSATLGGTKILEASRSMISTQEIVVGGCWDYINTIFERVGYSTNQRVTIYKSKFQGPYAKSDIIKPGDWIYFVNHSYCDREHSAIFVAWIDQEKKLALMVSYMGENKKLPGSYKQFTLDKIYNVIRAQD